jgi:hypothetical protein
MFDRGPPTRAGPRSSSCWKYEADLERTRELCAILADYDLFELLTMQRRLQPAPPRSTP